MSILDPVTDWEQFERSRAHVSLRGLESSLAFIAKLKERCLDPIKCEICNGPEIAKKVEILTKHIIIRKRMIELDEFRQRLHAFLRKCRCPSKDLLFAGHLRDCAGIKDE